eukprot:g6840.t1
MAAPDVTSFTAASVDLLVDFLDGIQVEFGSKPRRDGVVSYQELEMAFRRVRRRYTQERKASKVKPIIAELLQAIEGNGMTLRAWFEVMDSLAINNMVTQAELSSGMRVLQSHNSSRKKQPVLSADKIQELFVYMDANHDGTLELNEIALACKMERFKSQSSETMKVVTSMMQALDDYMGVHFMKIRDLFVHLDKDQSDGLSRAEIRCGFHAIQAEAKRRNEAAARRKRHEALRQEAREKEARKAEEAREAMKLLVEKRRKLSAEGQADWIPAPLASWQDPWVGEENGLRYKAAKGRTPAQALVVYFRTFIPDDGPVYGVIMHPREYFGNVTMRVTKLFKHNSDNYAGLARILYPPDGAFQAVNAASGAAPSKPELRYIETDTEWRDVLSREFACKSEERLQRISKWLRDQLAVLSTVEEEKAPPAVPTVAAKDALGEVLEFVSNPENLWAVTKEVVTAVVSHVRAPRSESDEAPALAASILWKLSEYEDFVLPLLRADAAGVCAGAVEDLGPPRAGPLNFWLQVAVQSRKEFREGVERKTLSFACFALGHLVATSASIRGSIAHRSRLFDTLVSALRPRMAPSTAGGGAGGGLGPGSSPPQAVACAAFCLAHVTTGESAALISRWRLLAACSTLAGLVDLCIDQMEVAAAAAAAAAASPPECGGTPGSGAAGPGQGPKGDARGAASAGGGSLAVTLGIPASGAASSSAARTVVAAAGLAGNPDAFGSGGSGDGLPERPQKTTREVLSACALTLLRLLSFAAKHHVRRGGGGRDTRPDKAEQTATRTNNNNSDTSNNGGDVITINNNHITNSTHLLCPPPSSDVEASADTDAKANANVANNTRETRRHNVGVPDAIVAVVGSCLAYVAEAIDLAAGPRGALESVLTLLLPAAGLLVREQAALALGAIAGQGFQILTDLREARAGSAADPTPDGGGDSRGRGELVNGVATGGAMLEDVGEGNREEKRLLLWRSFCTGVVGGIGAQVILDCALPGSPLRPNSILLRDRAARAFSLVCLCACPTPASSVVVGGVVSLLRCREGDAVGGAAAVALWALCRVPENRKTFAKTRVVPSLMSLCEWSRENGFQSLHLYCLATLYLLSQEPENASQVSRQSGSIAKLVAWAAPSRGNQLLRVGAGARSVFPLTLREAQGVLFAVQDRAEYRGYCERICGGDPFSVEDTLALQLERRGPEYADLAGDSVVGLASLAVTLSSRSRLAVNGAVESVGRLLAQSIDAGGACVLAGAEAGRTRNCRDGLGAVRNVSPDETTSKLACHVLANLSRSDVHGVRNRLFKSHLASESKAMCRKSSGGTGPASVLPQKLPSVPAIQVQQSPPVVASGGITTAKPNDAHDDDSETISISSSVFRRDDGDQVGRHNTSQDKNAADLLMEESSFREARLDAQHRLRLLPAALWGERAKLADVSANGVSDGEESEPATATQHQHTFLTEGASAVPLAKGAVGPAAAPNHRTAKGDLGTPTGEKRRRKDPAATRGSSSERRDGDRREKVLPIGASALFAQAASLKRTTVTASVPLRWQSRVVALSSLRDSFREGATRGSPSMGRKMAIRRCRAYRRTKSKSGSNAGETNANPQKAAEDTAPEIATDADLISEPDPPESPLSTTGDPRRRPLTQVTSRDRDSHGAGGEAHDRGTRAAPPARPDTDGPSRRGMGAPGVLSTVEIARPSTAPTHADGKVMMRPLGRETPGCGGGGNEGDGEEGGGQDPPSVVFEPGFSRLRTRRVILDRVYRFTRHEEDAVTLRAEPEKSKTAGLTTSNQEQPGQKKGSSRVLADASAPPELQSSKPETDGDNIDLSKTARCASSAGAQATYPNNLQPWKPPMLFQFCKDPGKTGAPPVKETIILEPTSPTTHFAFKPPPHNYVDSQGNVVVETAPEGSRVKDDGRIRLDRFQHVPGSLVCRGNLAHVKGMDGRYYHHYSSSDRMWYMPEHPGPYPAPAEPPSLEQLQITPPRAEPPMSPVTGEDEFDDVGEPVVAADGRAWSVERSSVFAQRKRQCESRAVFNTEKVKRRRFETSFGRASKLHRFPRFVADGNRDIAIKKTSVKQEVALVRETLWNNYNTLLSSYNYYASLDGMFGEPDSNAYQLGRDQYVTFLSDILHAREKENKIIHDEVHGIFDVVNVEEESSTVAGLANIDRRLCEQEWMECMVRIGAALYRKETNNGSVARALGRFMAELGHRLPKSALLDPDTYRKERLYKPGLEKALTSRIDGFRALFQTYPKNNLAVKALRRRMQVPREELLRFSLTDWEMLVEDAGLFGRLERDAVKMVFLQIHIAGSPEDGQTVLNFSSFMKKTGIARIEPFPAAAADGIDAAEGGTSLDPDQISGGCSG